MDPTHSPLFASLSYSNITSTHLGYLANVTSDIQTQLDNTASAITGAASTITTSNLSPNAVLVSDVSGKVAVSGVPSANLQYVANLTDDAQSQLNAKANLTNATLTGNVDVTGNLALKPPQDATGILASTGTYDVAANTHVIVPESIDSADGGLGVLAGQLTLYVSNSDKTATNKSGYALTSILKSPAEFELVPLFIHKNKNLSQLDVGIYEGNVRVETDADCSVSWKFEGSTIRAPA